MMKTMYLRSTLVRGRTGYNNVLPVPFARLFSDKSKRTSVDSVENVYLHPLSQLVLCRLQDVHHDWLVQKGLDTNLTIHRDGTFVLKFRGQQEARIWTAYDTHEKKHWLSVTNGSIQRRFMMQDNLMPAWHGNKRKSLPMRIGQSVDELVKAVEELKF